VNEDNQLPDQPIRSRDDLCFVLAAPEQPEASWRIGAESEKFGVHERTGQALQYDGDFGVLRIFEWLIRERGWAALRETVDGPIIALSKEGAGITLEPGAQFELSGAALPDVHAVAAEHERHLADVGIISRELGIVWLMTGFHPLARQEELSWVPKARYAIMREYLPKKGNGAVDMMRRTATVQGNYDWSSEADAMKKLRAALKISPLVHTLFANAPFAEGRANGLKSQRGDVWLRMDPSRSGLIPSLWEKRDAGYADYVEWALDAGMFLIKRGERVVANTGQTFRDFLANGFEGHRATFADWRLHLNTLFPEARLKGTLEVRCGDSLPPPLAMSLLALWTGIFYDARALDEVTALTEGFRYEAVEASRPGLLRDGLRGTLAGEPVRPLAERLLEVARAGLERRNRQNAEGASEASLLAPIEALVSQGLTPADVALARAGENPSPATIRAATAIS
jgi:glutamate--cysteine ligase